MGKALRLWLFLWILLGGAGLLGALGRREPAPPVPPASADPASLLRERMVESQIVRRGVTDERVLQAMRSVPRHLFVPEELRGDAYRDTPLPIGYGQTISQPYIVAFMTEALEVRPGHRILEVGTGSGYQAAVLAELTGAVFTIEILEPLARQAEERLRRLGYGSARVRCADGYYGWQEEAPFDGIIVTAAAGHVPPPLIRQLAPGGRIIIPVGGVYEVQTLMLIQKDREGKLRSRQLLPVQFVPMTGAVRRGGGEEARPGGGGFPDGGDPRPAPAP